VRGARRCARVCATVFIPNQSPATEPKVTVGSTRCAPADNPLRTRWEPAKRPLPSEDRGCGTSEGEKRAPQWFELGCAKVFMGAA